MKKYFVPAVLLLLFGCSSSEQTTKETQKKEPHVYVFDDVSKVDSTKADTVKVKTEMPKPEIQEQKSEEKEPPKSESEKFIVQLGAFSTKERAQSFIDENKEKITQKMEIYYSDKVKLFVVQLPVFSSYDEAEKTKNDLRKIPAFKDAFVTVSRGTN